MSDPRMSAVRGDITRMTVDALVNAANSELAGGGGVDGAIHRAGGPVIAEECARIRQRQGGCPTGEAVITGGGNLPARYVIHAVGPVWRGGAAGEQALLESAYQNSLRLAVEHGLRSVAFPNISTGVYGFPKELAAATAVRAVERFLAAEPSLERVVFVCFDAENHELYRALLEGA